jgi:hypothetical protein
MNKAFQKLALFKVRVYVTGFSGFMYSGKLVKMLAKRINGFFRPIVLDGVYSFYFGFLNSVADPGNVLEALIGLNSKPEFMNQKIIVQVERVDFINPHLEASRIL